MAKIAKKLTDLVGNTPLMELSGYSGKYGLEQNIIAKLESDLSVIDPTSLVSKPTGMSICSL